MNRRKIIVLLLSVVLTVCCICTACAQRTSAAESDKRDGFITVTDTAGREISVCPGSYESVVCIGAGALRMYSYLCGADSISGVEDIDNMSAEIRPEMFDGVARPYFIAYDEKFAALPSCGTGGPNAQTAEAERIISCKPDIVVSAYDDADKADALQEQLGIPVISVSTGPDGVFDELFVKSMNLLGTVFSCEERAKEILSFVESEADEIFVRTSKIPDNEKPSVYICGLGNWGTTDYLSTASYYAPFRIAGINNAAENLELNGVQKLERETFVAMGDEIDVMIIDAAAVKNIIPEYEDDSSIFDSCNAWNSGNVFLQMSYNAYYTNFEICLINTWFVAKSVYPELFDDIDITVKMDEVTAVFQGKGLSEEINECPQSYGGYQKIDTETFFGGMAE